MTTATARYLSDPLTLVGTERMTADRASNGVTGGTVTQDIANLFKGTKGSDLASAATVDLGAATGIWAHITGTTAITSFGTSAAGVMRWVVFDAALTLTHNSTSLVLPTGANITTAAGDAALLVSEGGGNWRCLGYWRKSGQPLATGASLQPVNALTNASGTVTVDCSLGINFTLTLSANVSTLTMSNLNGSGYVTEVEIEIKQDATGGRTFALPSSFKALGGSDTAIASAANAVTVLSAKTWDNGTTWRYAMQESA